jgi:hypothetical protein
MNEEEIIKERKKGEKARQGRKRWGGRGCESERNKRRMVFVLLL